MQTARRKETTAPIAIAPPPAPAPEPAPTREFVASDWAIHGLFILAAIAALYLSKAIAMPIVSGLILGFLLGPLADRMVKWRVAPQLAALLLVLGLILLTAAVISILAVPVQTWADRLPQMVDAIDARIAGLKEMMKKIGSLASVIESATSSGPAPKVAVSSTSPLISAALTAPAILGGLVIVLGTTFFYLATRRELKAMLLRLCIGRSARRVIAAFFDESEYRVATYLGVVTLINFILGAVTGLLAYAFGLSYPIFWAALAMVANYIAFAGPLGVVAALLAAGLVSFEGWMAAAPAAAYFAAHFIESQFITPGILGRRFTIPPLFVFIGLAFGLWLWGPIGGMLATPLLVIATVLIEQVNRDVTAG